MKRLLASRGTTAVLVAVAMLLVAGGTYALASGGNTITVCVHKHGGALYKAKKCKKGDKRLSWNKQGPQGNPGAPGAKGATGAPGAPGTAGFVSMGGWSGAVGTIAPATATPAFVFAGPVTTLTTTATQSIAASGSVALGSSGGALADVGECVSPTGAGTPVPLDNNTDGAFTELTINPTRDVYGESATGTPGAGVWDVGICVQNDSTTNAINNNDYSVGYAFVANGTVVSQAKKASHRP